MHALSKYKFGKFEVYGANKYQPYLDRQYPDKYAIIYQPYNLHYKFSGIQKKTKFTLTPKLLEHIVPC
jgi:phosphorylcholine metabolism protein LicD